MRISPNRFPLCSDGIEGDSLPHFIKIFAGAKCQDANTTSITKKYFQHENGERPIYGFHSEEKSLSTCI